MAILIDFTRYFTLLAAAMLLLLNLAEAGEVADTAQVQSKSQLYPQQLHLALSGKPGEMVVSWLTFGKINGPPEVEFSMKEGGPYKTAAGWTTRYYKSYHHNVLLKNLPSGARVFYRVKGSGHGLRAQGEEVSFVMPDVAGKGPFTVAMYGDMGVANSQDTIRRLHTRQAQYDFVYHVGDIGYADDYGILGKNKKYEAVYNQWAQSMEPITKATPYMVCPGNHDVTCHSYGEIPIIMQCPKELQNFSAYLNRFYMPFKNSKAVNNLWFSFDHKGVHFVSINTESDYPGRPLLPITRAGGFGDQVAWLKNDLRSVDRKKTQWIVVVGHRPMYTTNPRSIDFPPFQQERVKRTFEEIFYEYGVDFYVAGHVHAYERHFPVYKDKCRQKDYLYPKAPAHIVVGSAGNTEGHTKLNSRKPAYVAHRNMKDYGYGELKIYNATTAEWRYIAATTGHVEDRFVLTKQAGSRSFSPMPNTEGEVAVEV